MNHHHIVKYLSIHYNMGHKFKHLLKKLWDDIGKIICYMFCVKKIGDLQGS